VVRISPPWFRRSQGRVRQRKLTGRWCSPLSHREIPSGAVGKEIKFLLPPGPKDLTRRQPGQQQNTQNCSVVEHLRWNERCRLVQTRDRATMDRGESQEVETCEATPLTFSPALLPCCSPFPAAGGSSQSRRYRHLRTQTGERRHPGAGRS